MPTSEDNLFMVVNHRDDDDDAQQLSYNWDNILPQDTFGEENSMQDERFRSLLEGRILLDGHNVEQGAGAQADDEYRMSSSEDQFIAEAAEYQN